MARPGPALCPAPVLCPAPCVLSAALCHATPRRAHTRAGAGGRLGTDRKVEKPAKNIKTTMSGPVRDFLMFFVGFSTFRSVSSTAHGP